MHTLFGVLITITLLTIGCSQGQSGGGFVSVINDTSSLGGPDEILVTPFAQATQVASGNSSQPAQETQSQRVILKNATLTITVDDPAAKIGEIMALAESMGGWVVSSTTSTTTGRAGEDMTSGTITVRVPAERLDEALETIKSGTLSVDNENISGQDVTQVYVDTSSRLKNLQASEEQLLTIMDSAETVEDVLAVQRELTNVRSEIEIAQGRINYFDEAAAFSSIRVDVRPKVPGPVEAQQVGWNPGTTAEGALGTLVGLLQFTVDAIIVLAIVGLPLALIVGVVVWLLRRLGRRFNFQWIGRRTDVKETSSSSEATP